MDSKTLLDFLARLNRVGKVGDSNEKEKEVEDVWKRVEGYAVERLMA